MTNVWNLSRSDLFTRQNVWDKQTTLLYLFCTQTHPVLSPLANQAECHTAHVVCLQRGRSNRPWLRRLTHLSSETTWGAFLSHITPQLPAYRRAADANKGETLNRPLIIPPVSSEGSKSGPGNTVKPQVCATETRLQVVGRRGSSPMGHLGKRAAKRTKEQKKDL